MSKRIFVLKFLLLHASMDGIYHGIDFILNFKPPFKK